MWLPTFQKRNEDLHLHPKMPAARRKATQQHNNISNGLKREKALRLEFEQEEAEREERERVAAEKEKRKEAEDALNQDFTGRMAGYKKCDLRALAVALSISDKGTNAELLTRIRDPAYFRPRMQQYPESELYSDEGTSSGQFGFIIAVSLYLTLARAWSCPERPGSVCHAISCHCV